MGEGCVLGRHETVSPFRRCSGGEALHATLNNLSTPKFKELAGSTKAKGSLGGEGEGVVGWWCVCCFVLCCLFIKVGTG